MNLQKAFVVVVASLLFLAAAHTSAVAGSAPWIKGKLIVQPNAPINPGKTTLTFDADITGLSPKTSWRVGVEVVERKLDLQSGKVVSAAHLYSNILGTHRYKVPCAVGQARQLCFKLYAFLAQGVGENETELGTVCRAVRPFAGPNEPQLHVNAPGGVGTGRVLHFSADIPRRDCGHEFRVIRSPIDAPRAWSTALHVGCPSTPAIAFPETFTVRGSVKTVAGYSEPTGPLCFVLEDHDASIEPVDKTCWSPPSRVEIRRMITVRPAESTATTQASTRKQVFLTRGARLEVKRANTSVLRRNNTTPVLPKPNLVIEFDRGSWNQSGWGPPTGFKIWNKGKVQTRPSEVRFSKPGIAPTLVPLKALCPGCFAWIPVTSTAEVILYAGGGTVMADALHQVAESNEADNTYVWKWNPR